MEENNLTIFKKGLAYMAIVSGVLVALEQNGTGKEHDYPLGVAGGVIAVASAMYLSRLRKEEQGEIGEIKPYKIIGKQIILDPSEYETSEPEQNYLG